MHMSTDIAIAIAISTSIACKKVDVHHCDMHMIMRKKTLKMKERRGSRRYAYVFKFAMAFSMSCKSSRH
jgi:hypothetical protein